MRTALVALLIGPFALTACLGGGNGGGATSPDAVSAEDGTGSGADGSSTDAPSPEPDAPAPEPDTPAPDVPGPEPDVPGPEELCCVTDADCGAGQVCAIDPLADDNNLGRCVAAPEVGACYHNGHCNTDDLGPPETCEGETIAPCGSNTPTVAGTCVATPTGCCVDDQGCAAGEVCTYDPYGGDETPGYCSTLGEPGTCFHDEHCLEGQICKDPSAGDCFAQPGWIGWGQCEWPQPEACCTTDDECGDDEVCQGNMCLEKPSEGQCWDNGDCDCGWDECDSIPQSYCAGANYCSCYTTAEGLPDCGPVEMGTCKPLAAENDCCHEGLPCTPGLVCAQESPSGAGGGICLPPTPDGCWNDSECETGYVCEGVLICPCDADCNLETNSPGQCVPAPWTNCCESDAQCPEGQVCGGGACEPPAAEGECWDNGDCGAGEKCVGVQQCPCDALCDAVDEPGWCEPVGSECCSSDGDCASGKQCVGGYCQDPPPEPYDCWTDADCGEGLSCKGASYCICGFPCTLLWDAPGMCEPDEPPASFCCGSDADCGPGYVCGGDFGDNGVCKKAPSAGECWEDGDCADDQVCFGGILCPCNAFCPIPDSPGECKAKVFTPCCETDSDCIEDMVCAEGTCAAPPGPGQCWDDGDCGEGSSCKGAAICPCEALCDMEDTPGTCQPDEPPASFCCGSDEECGPGYVCAGEFGDSNVCVLAPPAGQCWDNGDCGAGEMCQGASACPCNAFCIVPDTPGECVPAKPEPGCCLSDFDCEPDQVCAEGGICKSAPLVSGQCWADSQCGAWEACVGASICPCGYDCFAADMPGFCQPVPFGACCETDADCGAGWVCSDYTCGAPPGPGQCWDDGDCGEGGTCEGAWLCPCNADCDGFDQMGTCSYACAQWDGLCLDAIPEAPWWYFDGTSCQMEVSCIGVGPGVYDSAEACAAACGT